MTRRRAAVATFAVSLAFYVFGFVAPFVWGAGWSSLRNPTTIDLFGAAFAVLGLLIGVRRPDHRIGPSFAWAGFFSAVQAAASAYADAAFRTGGPHLPGAAYAGNLTQWIFAPSVLLGYTLPFLWFPDGRLLSSRWRWAVRVGIASTALSCFTNITAAGPLNNYKHVENPLGLHSAVIAPLNALGILAYVGTLFAAIVSVVLRYRRSHGVERLQMRWFMVGVAATAVSFSLQMTLVVLTGDVGFGVLLMSILPICATIAILRYRLFDIERVVSRTVTYAAVTALVVAPYAVLVLLAGRIGRGSSATVAALTLIALGALRPVHRRLQRVVDRRFNRERYDAARTIDAFAARLRDEVDPAVVRADLLDAATRAMQPATVSLWTP